MRISRSGAESRLFAIETEASSLRQAHLSLSSSLVEALQEKAALTRRLKAAEEDQRLSSRPIAMRSNIGKSQTLLPLEQQQRELEQEIQSQEAKIALLTERKAKIEAELVPTVSLLNACKEFLSSYRFEESPHVPT